MDAPPNSSLGNLGCGRLQYCEGERGASISLGLLGSVYVRGSSGAVGGLTGRRTQELLCYLVVHASKPIRREVLAERLWGEAGDVQPRKQLRQSLWLLHHALDDAGVCDLLDVSGEWLQFPRSDAVWTDVWALEDAFLAPANLHEARAAVELYRGDLLDGCYLEWCLLERERCRTMYLAVLERLLATAVATGDFVAGTTYGTAILREDRAHERTHRCLIQLLADRGDRTGALRQYERCRLALSEELGVEPAPATDRLRESLLRATAEPIEPGTVGERKPSTLDELARTLERAQTLVRDEIARRGAS